MSSESESENELIENSGGEEDDGNDVDDKDEPEETNGNGNDKEITWHDLVRKHFIHTNPISIDLYCECVSHRHRIWLNHYAKL